MRAILSLIFAPYWVHFVLAGLVAAGGFLVQKQDAKIDALKIEIAAQPQPIVQPIETFSQSEAQPALEEVHVRAQIVPSQSILLRQKDNNGTVTDESLLYLFYAADAGAEMDGKAVPLVAYGGAVVPIAQQEMFTDWVMRQYLKGGAAGPMGAIVDLEGMWRSGVGESQARKGMKKYDTKTSKNFFYIKPFYEGRAAGVAYTPKDLRAVLISYFIPAFGFLALGVLKLLWALTCRQKAVRKSDIVVVQPLQSAEPVPEMAQPLAPNDFIGALGARKAAAVAEQAPNLPRRHLGARLSGGYTKAGLAIAALAIYLVFANFENSFEETNVIMLTPFEVTSSQGGAAAPATDELSTLAVLQGKANEVLRQVRANAKAQLHLGGIAMPFWQLATLVVGLILMAMIIGSRLAGQNGAKRSDIDPFDRLLQRRQAEKAREAQTLMMGRAPLRA